MEIIGKQIEVGVGVENVRGTAQSTAEKWVKKISATVIEKAEKVNDESTCNVLADSLNTRLVKKWVEGDLEGNVHADAIGYLLYNLYGAVTSSLVTGSIYSHAFTLANSIQHASLSLFAKDGSNSQEVFSNCMLSSLEISATVDEYVKFTASFMGKEPTANSDTPSYDTEYDFVGRDITIKLADTEGGLAGATASKVKEVSINFDTGLISDHILGSYTPDDIYNAQMAIEVELTLNYDDDTFKDLYTADTDKYVQIAIVGEADLGSSNYPTLTLLLNKAQVTDWSRDDSSADLVSQSVTLKAFYNATDSQQSEITLINVTSEYDTPIS
ncbi:MAG: hypothetical protein GY781_13820 [Gammaproteobacteria bacterium]|nr:hypothetical protein [Gammaproteobacteria bacterium]